MTPLPRCHFFYSMIDRKTAPIIQAIKPSNFPKPNKWETKNNIPLFTLKNESQEVFKIEFTLENDGEFSILERKIGNKLLKKGTKGKSAEVLASKFDYFGSFWGVETFLDNTTFYILGLTKFFKPILELAIEILESSIYPSSEFSHLIRIEKEKTKINWEKNDFIASQLFRKHFYENDSYGKIITPEIFDDLNFDNLKNYYRKNWQNKISKIFLSGNFTENNIIYLLRQLESFQPLYSPNLPLAISTNSSKKLYLEKEKALQTSIRYGLDFINRSHQDYPKAFLANFILGGYFGSRLQKNIREEKGFTYGIHSSIVNMQRGTYLSIGTSVNKLNKEETIEEITKEINLLKNELVSQDELETVKNYLLGNFQSEINSSFDIIEKIKIIEEFNLEDHYYENFQDQIIQCSANDIREATNRYIDPEKAFIQLVG